MTVPYVQMYDAIHDRVGHIPAGALKVAGYVSGANHGYYWTAADWARFPRAGHIRIDTDGSKPLASDVLDVEPGDASTAGAVRWAKTRQAHNWWSDIYASESKLSELRAAMRAAGVTKVRYWVAHWGLTEAQAAAKLGGDIVAVQYQSPSTQAGLQVDLSVARADWFPAPVPPAPKPPTPVPTPAVLKGLVVTGAPGAYATRAVQSTDSGKSWH